MLLLEEEAMVAWVAQDVPMPLVPRAHDDRIHSALSSFEAATARIVKLLEGLNRHIDRIQRCLQGV
jgi:hypothetical protein